MERVSVVCKRAVLAVALSIGCLAADAHAALITQTSETTGQTRNGADQFGGVFNQFNPALGSLQAVTLNFSGAVDYTVGFSLGSSPCGGGCGASFGFSTGYSFNAPGFPLTQYDASGSFFALVNWSGYASPPNLTSQSSGPFSISYEGDPASLLGYTGTGQVSVVGGISEDSDYCYGYGGVSCTTWSSNLDLTTTLTYSYLPIPEPSSRYDFMGALAILALVGLAGTRRMARSVKAAKPLN
jgi:hypothetical protein